MVARRRLCLVLDLDHTLIHSVPVRRRSGGGAEGAARAYNESHLIMDGTTLMAVRPSTHEFLERCAQLFDMCVFTMGTRPYALAVQDILDPARRYFKGEVVSRTDSQSQTHKNLDVFMADPALTIVVDDTATVWPTHLQRNLFHISQFVCYRTSSRDEVLPHLMGVLERVHASYYNAIAADSRPPLPDVRHHMAGVRQQVLAGCVVLFAACWDAGVTNVADAPLWTTAEELGADCLLATKMRGDAPQPFDEEVDGGAVTHIVSPWRLDLGGWGCHVSLVSPEWLRVSHKSWARQDEPRFMPSNRMPAGLAESFSAVWQNKQ